MEDELQERLQREELIVASVRKRAFSMFIDEMLLSLLLIIVLWDSFTSAQSTEEIIVLTNTFVLEFMIMKIVYQTFFTIQYGATLGKIIMKIRIIEVSTLSTPTFTSAFNRAVFRIISELFLYLGFLWGTMNPEHQTWHDKTARTLVVNA
ncbi:MAG: RDD family protein [Campylobacterota bacterium]|nr:RDD family protein [Campylobacterota bacterium]